MAEPLDAVDWRVLRVLSDGSRIGIIKTPEVPANLCFGGPDMKTLFFTARTSIYSLRAKVPGLPGHPYRNT